MSISFDLCDPVTRETLCTDTPHQIRGATYAVGGTTLMCMSVTYNYCHHYFGDDRFGDEGIRVLNNMSGADSIPLIERTISCLGDDTDDNYWNGTEGNAKRALYGLLAFAKLRPDGVWSVF